MIFPTSKKKVGTPDFTRYKQRNLHGRIFIKIESENSVNSNTLNDKTGVLQYDDPNSKIRTYDCIKRQSIRIPLAMYRFDCNHTKNRDCIASIQVCEK